MPIRKQCADHLRAHHRNQTGGKLSSGHAHEIVAAYFGYGNVAALKAEVFFPLSGLGHADILIPDLPLMDRRVTELKGLPADLDDVDALASEISAFLTNTSLFTGDVWYTRDLEDYISGPYIQERALEIEDELADQMALTNAFFDEVYVDEAAATAGASTLVVELDGSLNGETAEDQVFCGDKVNFSTTLTFQRVAGRVAYTTPEMETSGAVDMSYAEPDDDPEEPYEAPEDEDEAA
jgi:hypothetical protein